MRNIVVEREVDKPVVPVTVEAEIRKRTDQWSWNTTIFGSGGAGLAALAGMDWQTVTAIGALALGGLIHRAAATAADRLCSARYKEDN